MSKPDGRRHTPVRRPYGRHLIDHARLEGYIQGLRLAKLAAMAVTKEYTYFRYQQFIDVIEGYERDVRRALDNEANT